MFVCVIVCESIRTLCGTSKSVNQRNGIINKNAISYKSSDVSIKHKQHDTIRKREKERGIEKKRRQETTERQSISFYLNNK